MYVRKYEEEKPLSKNVFNTRGKAAVMREVDCHHQIYGDLLRSLVWHQKPNGHHCVILPYFEPVAAEERIDRLNNINNVLTRCFSKQHDYQYMESDIRRQHIGKREGEIYLFDLADLKKRTEDDYKQYVEKHVKHLEERI